MEKIRKFKKGAASFYIVAISTLILVIIAASFAAVIISEIARTSNDDLAQSAYDAALAGVEDAKLAYYNYQSCKEDSSKSVDSGLSCEDIINWVENGTLDGHEPCDMVATILGRSEEGEVLVEESSSAGNNMQQAYTCVTMSPTVASLKATLNSSNPTMVMPARFDDGTKAEEIKSIQVSWYLNNGEDALKYSNFDGNGIFGENAPVPPVLSVGLIQTGGNSFNLSDFDMTQVENEEQKTDRGTVYLVPTDKSDLEEKDNYWVVKDKYISKDGFLKSNDKTVKNKPYAVYCDGEDKGSEYACSVTIELPEPIGENRSDKTFMIVLSLPYAESGADVDLAFCKSKDGCSSSSGETGEGGEGEQNSERVDIKGVQISIDSTGRANDLYRRIETRLMPEAVTRPLYAINAKIKKNLSPTCENNFIDVPNCD